MYRDVVKFVYHAKGFLLMVRNDKSYIFAISFLQSEFYGLGSGIVTISLRILKTNPFVYFKTNQGERTQQSNN